MKATAANFHYGAGAYPVHTGNLPNLDDEAIEHIVNEVRRQMRRLSGGFPLPGTVLVTLYLSGDGWDASFEDEVS